jgi:hypothetical protein
MVSMAEDGAVIGAVKSRFSPRRAACGSVKKGEFFDGLVLVSKLGFID